MQGVVDRAHAARCLWQKLAEVPLSLDYPYWISNGGFDPEFHIRHIALPEPGNWRQLCIQTARLHSRRLDRAHPLWEMYVIDGLDRVEGLPPGCFAIFTKVHHAAIDGVSGMEVNAALHDLSPEPNPDMVGTPPAPDRDPSTLELLARSQINNLIRPFRFASAAIDSVMGFARAASRLGLRQTTKMASMAPKTRFNNVVTPHRVFESVLLNLEEVKAIKLSLEGATINDAILTIVGGALRQYMLDKGELPKASMTAMTPINVRAKNETGAAGNKVSSMVVSLSTNIADARKRMEAIYQTTRQSKELVQAIGAKVMTNLTEFTPSAIAALGARTAARAMIATPYTTPFNCTVTNVPGAQVPLYCTGAQMVWEFGTAPLLDGMGLMHAIISYNGAISISITSCREMVPDPAYYAQCLQESFESLKAACGVALPVDESLPLLQRNFAKPAAQKPSPKPRVTTARKSAKSAAKKPAATSRRKTAQTSAVKKSAVNRKTTAKATPKRKIASTAAPE